MLIKAICKQSTLLRFSYLSSSFSKPKKNKYSKSAQTAILATAIMKKIVDSTPLQNFQQKSLREKILQLKLQNEQIQLDKDVQSNVLKMFSSGINLNKKVFPHLTMKIETQKPANDSQVFPQQQAFIFCPDALVTKKVFSIFLSSRIQTSDLINIMITGSFTNSIMLFIRLSNFVHGLFYLAKHQVQKKQQLNQLIKENLIYKRIPKVIYWSVNMESLDLNIFEHVLQQFPQISQKHKLKLSQFKGTASEFKQQIQSIYPTKYGFNDTQLNIYKIMFIDRIDELASYARIYNQSVDTNLCNPQQKSRIQKALKIIKLFHQCTNRLVFSSSVNIQQHLLKRSRDNNKIGLQFCDNHQQMIYHQIPFEQGFEEIKWRIFDLAHYFWLELTRSYLNSQQITEKLNQIRKQHMNQVFKTLPVKPYFRSLYVKQFLSSKQTKAVFNISEGQTIPQIVENIKLLLKDFLVFCIKSYGQRLKKFMNNDISHQKFRFLLTFYQQAQNQQYFEINRSQFYEMFGEKTSNYKQSYRQIDKQKLKPSDFMEISAYALFPVVQQFYPLKIFEEYNNKRFLCCAFESYLIKNLAKDAIIQIKLPQFEYSSQKQRYKAIDSDIKTITICNQQQIFFIALNAKSNYQKIKNRQKFIGSFERNFKELLDICSASPSKYFVATPKIDKQERYQKDGQSASIDFVIAKFEEGRYQIFTFDATVRNQGKTVNLYSKQKQAKQILKKIINHTSKQINVTITHIILSFKIPKFIPKQIHSPAANLTVTYSNWGNMKIINSNRPQQGIFTEVVRLLKEAYIDK